MDSDVFKQWTNGSSQTDLDNLKRGCRREKITIRVPLIRGFNADEASVTAITNFAADELGVHDIHFLPYHTLGMNKYTLLGQPYSAPDKPLDNPALLDFAQQYACQKGLTATLRG